MGLKFDTQNFHLPVYYSIVQCKLFNFRRLCKT